MSNARKARLLLATLAVAAIPLIPEADADSARVCEQSIQYDVRPISAGISPELRKFAGVWQGRQVLGTALQTCMGLVVYGFEPGRFLSRFIWSADAGMGTVNRSNHGNIARTFEFSNGVARFKGPEVLFELQMTSDNEISGYRTDSQGARFPVWFKRN